MPIRALLVDDDVAYLEVLSFFLEREGSIESETATSARAALDLLSKKEYDAIVSDYLMPDMDGLELLKIVRLQGKDVPFIMLTGRGREDVAIQALNSGADFYIQKGGDPKAQYTDLSNMIKRSAQQRRAERSVREGERFLKGLFLSIQDGVTVLNKDLVIEMVNPTIEKWYAESMPLVGKKCYEAYRGRSEPCDVCPTLRTVRTGRMANERIKKGGVSGGNEGWLDVYSFPILNEATGEVERVIEYLRDVTAEESAKASLRDSEHKYRMLVDLANEGILAIESGGTIGFVNPRMAEMIDCEVEDLIGKHVSSIVDSKWAESVGSARLHKALEGGERFELVLARKDGSRINVIAAASPLSAGSGLFQGAMAVVTEITEIKAVMESLVSSEEKFAKVFQDSPQLIMIARTSDSTILEVNDSFTRVTGYRRDQLLGKNPVELGIFSEELAVRFEESFGNEGIIRDLEVPIGTVTGEPHLVRISGHRMMLQGEQCTVLVSCDISADVAGMKALRRERDVLKAILESNPDGIVITDLDGNVVECNLALLTLLGNVSKEQFIGRNVFTQLKEIDAAKAKRVGAKLMSEGLVRNISFELAREDGIKVHADVSAVVVKDQLRKPLYLIGIVRDVTDQVRHEAELEGALEDRRQLVSIINQSPAVAFLWRAAPGWPVDYVSENVRQFGYEAGELTSDVVRFASIVHPDDLERIVTEVQTYVKDGRSEFEQEYRLVSPDGKVHWVYDRTLVIRDRTGAVDSYQGVVVDITDRKDVLEKLSRAERQLKMFMDMSPVVKFMKGRDGRYVYVNKAYQEVFGITPDEWIGKTDRELFPSEVAERLMATDRKVFESGKFHAFLEVIPREDGLREFLTYRFLVPSITGGEDLLAGVAIDLTEERRYERALKAANEKLTLLGSMTRHDITNQLAVLAGWLDITRDDVKDPVIIKRFDDMKAAADTIQRLLMFTSEYQDLGLQEPVWIPAAEAFSNGVLGLQLEGVQVEVDLPGLEVYADPMFERVFRNLADNSIRHGEKLSRMKVTQRSEGNELILTYEDDGVGIPEDIKDRIFEKGFGKHTGFGLFMARQVLGLTGLSIQETGTQGSGVRFEIRVPEGAYRYSPAKG